jgi:hypothetical protein
LIGAVANVYQNGHATLSWTPIAAVKDSLVLTRSAQVD